MATLRLGNREQSRRNDRLAGGRAALAAGRGAAPALSAKSTAAATAKGMRIALGVAAGRSATDVASGIGCRR